MKIQKDKYYIYDKDKSFIVQALDNSDSDSYKFYGKVIWVDKNHTSYHKGYESSSWDIYAYSEIDPELVKALITSCNTEPVRTINIKGINDEDFDMMSTVEGVLNYAKKHFPVGTYFYTRQGQERITTSPPYYNAENNIIYVYAENICGNSIKYNIYDSKIGWVKKKDNVKIQKLSRIGLEEIHSVACASWKKTLVDWAKNRNIFKEYIEVTAFEVNQMFKECNKEQLLIVSKYLIRNDNSVNLFDAKGDGDGIRLNGAYILRTNDGEADGKSFWLNKHYNWVIENGRLVPTKKNN